MNPTERAELIASIAKDAASSDDLEEVLQRTLSRLHDVIRFKGGSLAFPDESGMLRIVAAVGILDDAARSVKLRPGSGIVGTVFATGRSIRVGDLEADARVIPGVRTTGTNRLMRSYLCVPLSFRGTVFGTLEIDSTEREAFTADDQELLETIAAILAGVVRLARVAQSEREARLARDQFFSAVTHDLRNPLTVIRGQAQRLLRRHQQDEDTQPLAAIMTQTDRLARLIGGLVDVARGQAGEGLLLDRQEGDIAAFAENVARTVLGPDRAEQLHADVRPTRALFDERRVEQIVANLVENAVKYAPGAEIILRVWPEGDDVLISVADDGPGIPAEDRARIFERYGRGSRTDGTGLGLGLYIVRLAAEAHGGSVEVREREDGKSGSLFVVRLPLSPAELREEAS